MSNQPKKILIFYAKFGDGHYQVAKALKDQFTTGGEADVQLIDLFAEAHPFWNAFSRFVYEKCISWIPRLYGWSYEVTKGMRSDAFFGKWLHSFGMHRLKAILQEKTPDAVIHTFPFLAMYHLKSATSITIPGYTVITDYVLHSRWIHQNTDGYFVATDDLKAEMCSLGVYEDRIHVTGIPVRKEFNEKRKLDCIYESYGLHPQKRYIMVMAQAGGVFADLASLIPELIARKDQFSFLLICGRNAKLHRKAKERFKNEPAIQVLGYIEHIERLMSISSCIITKAGGITLTEALALHLPVIVYRPLPGQERGNAEYWSSWKAVRIANDVQTLRKALLDITDSLNHSGHVAPNVLAASDITNTILTRLHEETGFSRDSNHIQVRVANSPNSPSGAYTKG